MDGKTGSSEALLDKVKLVGFEEAGRWWYAMLAWNIVKEC